MKIHVKVAKDKRAIDVAHNATLFQVASLITQAFDGDLSVSSLTLLFKGRAFKPGQSQRDADTVLHNAGVCLHRSFGVYDRVEVELVNVPAARIRGRWAVAVGKLL